MRPFLDLFKRELRLVTIDHTLLLTLLIAPVLYAFFYGSIYLNKEESEVKIAVVDADGSHLSRTITEQINLSSVANVVPIANMMQAKQQFHEGKVQAIFFMDKGLEKQVLSLKQAHVALFLNTSRFLPSSDLTSTLTKICLKVGGATRLNYFKKSGNGSEVAMEQTQLIHFNYKPLFNVTGSYGGFLLPGLLALILQQTLLIGLAESMSSERENGKMGELLTRSRGSWSSLLWGKGLWYFLLFSCYALFFLTVNFHVLGLQIRGSGWAVGALFILLLLVLIPMGLLIGSFFKQQILSMQIMAFSTYPIFLITGYSMPFESLPKSVQWIADLIPTTPFLQAYQSIVEAGGTLSDNIGAIVHLIVLWGVYCGLLIVRLNHLKKKK